MKFIKFSFFFFVIAVVTLITVIDKNKGQIPQVDEPLQSRFQLIQQHYNATQYDLAMEEIQQLLSTQTSVQPYNPIIEPE